jgi:hypothetical protein
MPAEPPPEPSQESAPTAAPAGTRWAAHAQAIAEAERRVASPTPLTLRLLGVIFVATLLPWIGAKTACNLRDSPIRQPHEPATDVISKNAKSAALELSQRAASGRYREAAELARGDVAKELLAADARCQTQPAPCEQQRSQAEHVYTRAVVASRGPFEANVRTETRVGSDPPARFAMYLQQDEGRWYVVRRAPLQGEIDAPVSPEEVVSPLAIREVPSSSNSSVAPPLSPHGASPHGSAPSNGAPSGTGEP